MEQETLKESTSLKESLSKKCLILATKSHVNIDQFKTELDKDYQKLSDIGLSLVSQGYYNELKDLDGIITGIYNVLSERIRLEGIIYSLRGKDRSQSNQITFSNLDVRSMQESNPFPPAQKRLTEEQKSVLEEWYQQNIDHPYANQSTIESLNNTTMLSSKQIRNWYEFVFIMWSRVMITN